MSSFCTGKNSEMSLAPLMSFSYFSMCILPFIGSGEGFSGEGKLVSIMGSSGCLPWADHKPGNNHCLPSFLIGVRTQLKRHLTN